MEELEAAREADAAAVRFCCCCCRCRCNCLLLLPSVLACVHPCWLACITCGLHTSANTCLHFTRGASSAVYSLCSAGRTARRMRMRRGWPLMAQRRQKWRCARLLPLICIKACLWGRG